MVEKVLHHSILSHKAPGAKEVCNPSVKSVHCHILPSVIKESSVFPRFSPRRVVVWVSNDRAIPFVS
jgi:hypothetical protein